ncbi:MAG: hypothetical protein AUK34_03275 [Ignavibacteria bacterium CG2_30_36_16]|nr:hypothetical protein [Ignavibacteria bacterium]OIP62480.1 MAG: hypothetical protein AUK34_03275 [Ignavibacteria bacterium CG2_30_36_16]
MKFNSCVTSIINVNKNIKLNDIIPAKVGIKHFFFSLLNNISVPNNFYSVPTGWTYNSILYTKPYCYICAQFV